MAKYAFLVGANTKGLRFCDKDMDLMAECLSLHNFEVVRCKEYTKRAILDQWDEICDEVPNDSTLIFYFSGHSLIRGGLDLVINNENRITSRFKVDDVISSMHSSSARHGLVVLDCCYSGEAAKKVKTVSDESFKILTATSSKHLAKEISELKSSFFTFNIHRALTDRNFKDIDADGNIRIDQLYNWLKAQTKIHNSRAEDNPVAHPSLFGNQEKNMAIGNLMNINEMYGTKIKEVIYFKDVKRICHHRYQDNTLLQAEDLNKIYNIDFDPTSSDWDKPISMNLWCPPVQRIMTAPDNEYLPAILVCNQNRESSLRAFDESLGDSLLDKFLNKKPSSVFKQYKEDIIVLIGWYLMDCYVVSISFPTSLFSHSSKRVKAKSFHNAVINTLIAPVIKRHEEFGFNSASLYFKPNTTDRNLLDNMLNEKLIQKYKGSSLPIELKNMGDKDLMFYIENFLAWVIAATYSGNTKWYELLEETIHSDRNKEEGRVEKLVF